MMCQLDVHGTRIRRWLLPTAAMCLAICSMAAAGEEADTDMVAERGRLEAMDDPYMARPAIPPPGVDPIGVRVVRGEFVSVQVNVDENGNNIPGDAANEPSLTIDPTNPNNIAIGWRQFDSVNSNFRQAGRGYSRDAGRTWTFPGVFTPGTFRSDPVLDANAEGTMFYYSLTSDFTCDTFISHDGGVNWSNPIPSFGGDKAWMAVDRTGGVGHGNLYFPWSTAAGCCGSRIFTRSTDDGLGYMEPIRIADSPVWGTITVAPDGAIFISGAANSSGARVVRSSNAQDPDQAPTWDLSLRAPLGGTTQAFGGVNPAGLLGQVWIASDHSGGDKNGNIYLFGSVDPPGSDPLDVMFARSTDAGQTWSAPVRVNTDPQRSNVWQWFGTMSVAPNGRIDVVWNDTRADPQARFSELYHSFSEDGGVTWAKDIPVSPAYNHSLGYPQQNKLGDYYDMISDNGGANVAWAATFNGEQDVYFLRIDHSSGIPPTDLEVIRGRIASGDIGDLGGSDDSRMVFHPGLTQNPDEPPVWLILTGEATTNAPSELRFTLESRVNTPAVTQRIELFNYDLGEFEEIDVRATTLDDSVADIVVSGDPGRFIDDETLAMQAQLTWDPPPLVLMFPWSVGIDQAVWQMEP